MLKHFSILILWIEIRVLQLPKTFTKGRKPKKTNPFSMLQSSCKAVLLSSLALLLTRVLKAAFPIQMMRKISALPIRLLFKFSIIPSA